MAIQADQSPPRPSIALVSLRAFYLAGASLVRDAIFASREDSDNVRFGHGLCALSGQKFMPGRPSHARRRRTDTESYLKWRGELKVDKWDIAVLQARRLERQPPPQSVIPYNVRRCRFTRKIPCEPSVRFRVSG